ncbi:MAG: carbon storage regulator CsrA [Thiopseudomonas sp.]
MLVLTRHSGENIRIGNNITLRVIKCQNGQVRLGVDAPADIVVHREEVHQRIQAERREKNRPG